MKKKTKEVKNKQTNKQEKHRFHIVKAGAVPTQHISKCKAGFHRLHFKFSFGTTQRDHMEFVPL